MTGLVYNSGIHILQDIHHFQYCQLKCVPGRPNWVLILIFDVHLSLKHIVRSLARSEIVRIDLFWTGLTGYCQSPGSVCSASKPPQGDVWTPIQNTRQTRYKIDILHMYSGLEQIECGLYCHNDGGEDLLIAVFAFAHSWSPSPPGFLSSFFLHKKYNKGAFIIHYLCFQLSLDFCCYIFLISYVHVMLGFLRQIDI